MKNAIIIGATSGIGRALAQKLASENYKVGITGRRLELLNELKSQNPQLFFPLKLDIRETHKVAEAMELLVKQLGGLDLIVVSSGTGDLNSQLNFEIEHRTIETNVAGFTCVTNWAFNYFETQQSGHLVAISSVGGLRGSGIAPAYNATKAFQMNYLEGLRQKATKLRMPIFITDIRPGFVDTDMAKGEGQFWVSTVEKAANQIMVAIKAKKNIAYVTRRWRLVAFLLKRIPRSVYKRM